MICCLFVFNLFNISMPGILQRTRKQSGVYSKELTKGANRGWWGAGLRQERKGKNEPLGRFGASVRSALECQKEVGFEGGERRRHCMHFARGSARY